MTIDLESLRGIRRRISEIVQGTHDTRSEALVDLRELHSWGHTIDSELTARRARDAEVEALVAAQRSSIDEIERLRDAMFRVYATAANGGNVTPWIEKMRDEMDKPWSVDCSRAALLPFAGDKT